ncbi:hypothetical protein CBL_03500 [Carabus blaptoides fortunei]
MNTTTFLLLSVIGLATAMPRSSSSENNNALLKVLKKRSIGCYGGCVSTCNSCSGSSCTNTCNNCISNNCCQGCCQNKCDICTVQSCQINVVCVQCCQVHCKPTTPASSTELPTSTTESPTTTEAVPTTVAPPPTVTPVRIITPNTTNIVKNDFHSDVTNLMSVQNNVHVPINIQNINIVRVSIKSGKIVQDTERIKDLNMSTTERIPSTTSDSDINSGKLIIMNGIQVPEVYPLVRLPCFETSCPIRRPYWSGRICDGWHGGHTRYPGYTGQSPYTAQTGYVPGYTGINYLGNAWPSYDTRINLNDFYGCRLRPILLLLLLLSIAWSEDQLSRSMRKKRHYGCAQSCGQTCNSCNQGSCSGSCQSCISQNCCTNCCVNQCNVCHTQTCQSNIQCNQCCSQHCVQPHPQPQPQPQPYPQPYPQPQTSNQSSTTSTHTEADINGRINITNIVVNRNNVSVPITITNTNHVTADLDEESQLTSWNGSHSQQIIEGKDKEIYRPYPVPYPQHVYPPIRPIYSLPTPIPIPQPINTHPCYGVQCQLTRDYFNRKICETKSGQRCRLTGGGLIGEHVRLTMSLVPAANRVCSGLLVVLGISEFTLLVTYVQPSNQSPTANVPLLMQQPHPYQDRIRCHCTHKLALVTAPLLPIVRTYVECTYISGGCISSSRSSSRHPSWAGNSASSLSLPNTA